MLTTGLVVAAPEVTPAAAATPDASLFDPGYIISDENFYDHDAMSQAEIQGFLDAMIGPSGNNNRLNVLRVDTFDRPANNPCAAYQGAAAETAAAVIFKVQQACGISARVILVTLHKEQGLIGKTNPSDLELRKAMGYGCPDTAACDARYYGFYNQVYNAAWQFGWYRIGYRTPGSSFYGKYPLGQVTPILYHPYNNCGAPGVRVYNFATAALYHYTPYQPNAAALANLGGTGDACSSYGNRNFWVFYTSWFGSPTGSINPIGDINTTVAVSNGARITGWAFDSYTSDPINTHVYVDGVYVQTVRADQPRPDVKQAFPGQGTNHGFSATVPMNPGKHTLCLYGINAGPGKNSLIECAPVTIAAGGEVPRGSIDAAALTSRDQYTVRGWAFDVDTSSSILVDAWVNGRWAQTMTANLSRPDVNAAFPAMALGNHGFQGQLTLQGGSNQVCLYAINAGGGNANPSLGCRTVTVVTPNTNPVGDINEVSRTGQSALVRGWAFDSDTTGPILVDAWVNGRWAASINANQPRPDVKQAFPLQGDSHGFSATLPLKAGSNQICLHGINVAGGANTLLGCRTVTVPANSPIGDVNQVTAVTGGVQVSGWTFDPDTTDSIFADVWVNGAWKATLTADVRRTDVQAAYVNQSANHGFAGTVALAPGQANVCVYGINVGFGSNALLGCRTVTVAG